MNGNGATIKCHYATDFSRQPFKFSDASKNITFKNVRFDLKNKNILVLQGTNIKFLNCSIVKGSNGIGLGRGVQNLLVDSLKDEGAFSGNAFGFFGSGATRPNRNLVFKNCHIKYGSTGEHIFRFHASENVTVDNCFLDNSKSPVGKHSLNLRDGKDFLITNCYVNAPTPIGGLELPGEENKTLSNVTFRNTQLNGWIAVYSGVSNLLIENCSGIVEKGSYVFSCRKPFGNRQWATGTIRNSSFTYAGGKFITQGSKLKLENIKFNGKLITQAR